MNYHRAFHAYRWIRGHSIIIVMADHGHPLADHGKFLKGGDRLYNELLKVPFMVRLPGGAGARRTEAIVQFHDVLPTVLDLLGMANNTSSMHGRSFRPVLEGDTDTHREVIITGYHEAIDRCVRDRTWSYIIGITNVPAFPSPRRNAR
jgi:arylsulfatase A-like enzyme